jgi:hypothetical protein
MTGKDRLWVRLEGIMKVTLDENEIHAEAREATARQVYRSLKRCIEKENVAIGVILIAIDDWYIRGVRHGKAHYRKRFRTGLSDEDIMNQPQNHQV